MNHPSLTLLAVVAGSAGFGAGFLVSDTVGSGKGGGAEDFSAVTLTERPMEGLAIVEVVPPEDGEGVRLAFLQLAAADPIAAETEAREDEDAREKIGWIAEAMAGDDPEAAFRWASKLENMEERSFAFRGIMHALIAARDFETAMDYLDRLPVGRLRDFSASPLIEALAETDPERAVRLGEGLAREWSERSAAENIAGAYTEPGEEDEFWKLVEGAAGDSFRRSLAIGFIKEVADEDPERALRIISERTEVFDTLNSQWIYGEIAEEFGEKDPKMGLEMARGIAGEFRTEFLEDLGERWGETMGEQSSDYLIERLNDSPDKDLEVALGGALGRLMRNDQEKVFEIISQIEDPDVRDRMHVSALGRLAERNQELASAKLTTLIEEGDPRSADITTRLMRSWMRDDPGRASQWLDRQTPGPAKDRGIEALVENILRVDQDYRGALAWTAQVDDTAKRAQLEAHVNRQIEQSAPRP